MIEGGDDEFKQENVALFPGNNQLSETSKMMEGIDLSQRDSFDNNQATDDYGRKCLNGILNDELIVFQLVCLTVVSSHVVSSESRLLVVSQLLL